MAYRKLLRVLISFNIDSHRADEDERQIAIYLARDSDYASPHRRGCGRKPLLIKESDCTRNGIIRGKKKSKRRRTPAAAGQAVSLASRVCSNERRGDYKWWMFIVARKTLSITDNGPACTPAVYLVLNVCVSPHFLSRIHIKPATIG